MSATPQLREVLIPDLADVKDTRVIEVLVSVGSVVSEHDSLLTLESEKATMDVPSPFAGVVREVLVAVGDAVETGRLLMRLEVMPQASSAISAPNSPSSVPPSSQSSPAIPKPPAAASLAIDEPVADIWLPLVVLGAGPGGYTAAFRAADLGLEVGLIERGATLGGVCLNVGCIPSKALLHAAKVIEDAESMGALGVSFGPPQIDMTQLQAWKSRVVGRLTQGLSGLAKKRKVRVLSGEARFVSPHRLELNGPEGRQIIGFEQCIIAAGSEPVRLPGAPQDHRILDSTGALALDRIPASMLVIGGGIIGLEMASVYSALGTRITVVELGADLMPGCDRDLVRPLEKRLRARFEAIYTSTQVVSLSADPAGIAVAFKGADAPTEPQRFDVVLVAIGRRSNGRSIGVEAAGLTPDEHGFIRVDRTQRTEVSHLFAIGDLVGNPMLAHKASHEGKVAAEVAAGLKRAFDARVIPSVAYTDPEVAWVGLTETDAKTQGIEVGKGVFPWAASGRSLAINREEGFTKLLFDPSTHRVLGAGIVGSNAGDLIAEVALAIEMGADAHDLGLTIHPHPTLSETVGLAAEAFEGTLTDLYIPRKS